MKEVDNTKKMKYGGGVEDERIKVGKRNSPKKGKKKAKKPGKEGKQPKFRSPEYDKGKEKSKLTYHFNFNYKINSTGFTNTQERESDNGQTNGGEKRVLEGAEGQRKDIEVLRQPLSNN